MKTNTHELLDEIVQAMWPDPSPEEGEPRAEVPDQPGPDEVDSAYGFVVVEGQRFKITVTYEGEVG